MLTNRDYCDYDTCVALKEVGCDQHYDKYKETNSKGEYIFDWFTLYEAQKWLREEKGLHIEVFFSLMDDKRQLHYDWHIVHNIRFDDDEYTYDCDVLDSMGSYKSYEEALSEGIKEAVKILKKK